MRFLKPFISIATLAILLITACSPTPITLAGSGWILSNLMGKTPIVNTAPTLIFQDGNVAGSDSCNRYNGSYTQDGKKLEIGPDLVSTMMACSEDIMQQSSTFQEMLTQVETFIVDGEKLMLNDADGNELATFEKQDTQLSGTNWIVTGYNNGNQAVTSVLLDSEITVMFNNDGTISGDMGCNSFSGGYVTEGSNVTISELLNTLKACDQPEGIMEQETQFLTALSTVSSYRIEGSQLEMRTTDDALAVTLTRN